MARGRTTTILCDEEDVRIPGTVTDLGRFRAWARSDAFPERGRIDWIAREVWIDMSPEDANTHGSPKAAIAVKLGDLVEGRLDTGVVYIDRTRISVPGADLSVEPDVVVILFDSLESGRVKLVPKASREPGRFIEVQGPPDIVVECVSDSSEDKDTEKLLAAYRKAGVAEYWLVDARAKRPVFTLFQLRKGKYVAAPRRRDGTMVSSVLGRAVRLVRRRPRAGIVRYRLEDRRLSKR